MTTPEGKVKQKINRLLAQHGASIYRYMPVPSGYSSATLDYLCCAYGRFIAIEAKREGGKLTPLQMVLMERIDQAGGVAILVNGDVSLNILAWLLDQWKHDPLPSNPPADIPGQQPCSRPLAGR